MYNPFNLCVRVKVFLVKYWGGNVPGSEKKIPITLVTLQSHFPYPTKLRLSF